MTFYGSTASAAGLVVPKNYLEQVGEKGFGKKPVGAGPYKYVSGNARHRIRARGLRAILAQGPPNVKTIVMRSVPDGDTRALMVKTGEADIAVALEGTRRRGYSRATRTARSSRASTPRASGSSFPTSTTRNRHGTTSGCDLRSPMRSTARGSTRRPASASARRPASSCRASWNSRCRSRRTPTTRKRRSNCSPKPAIPTGHRRRPVPCDSRLSDGGGSGGQRSQRGRHPGAAGAEERAAFYADWKAHKFQGLYMTGAGAAGNAASRVETFMYSKGGYASGGYPGYRRAVP